jgi:hypothetical protein
MHEDSHGLHIPRRLRANQLLGAMDPRLHVMERIGNGVREMMPMVRLRAFLRRGGH